MKPLIGLLLVVSGTVLAVPPVYEVLSYIVYDGRYPAVPILLGTSCIFAGLFYLVLGSSRKKGIVEISP